MHSLALRCTPLTHSSHTLLSHTPLTHSLNYTNTQFHKVLRVLDPDQSGGIDRKEFLDLMVNHLKTQQEEK